MTRPGRQPVVDDTSTFLSRFDFPLKINVHIPVRLSLLDDCMHFSAGFCNFSRAIDFRPRSIHTPHITLYGGNVASRSGIGDLLEAVSGLANKVKRFQMKAGKPYVAAERYIFSDIEPRGHILDLKQQVKRVADPSLEPLDWDVAAAVPHITLGYMKEMSQEAKTFVERSSLEQAAAAEAFEVSVSGVRGTCLGSLKTFPLAE